MERVCSQCGKVSNWEDNISFFICPDCGAIQHIPNSPAYHVKSPPIDLSEIDRLYPYPKIEDYAPNWSAYSLACAEAHTKRQAIQNSQKNVLTRFREFVATFILVFLVVILKYSWRVETLVRRGTVSDTNRGTMTKALIAGIDSVHNRHSND